MGWEQAERSPSPHWTLPAPWGPRSRKIPALCLGPRAHSLIFTCPRFLSKLNYLQREACMCAQSCLTLCNPMGCSPPGSPVQGIFQARILEWVAISSSRGFSQSRDWRSRDLLCLLHWQMGSLPLSHLGSPPLEKNQCQKGQESVTLLTKSSHSQDYPLIPSGKFSVLEHHTIHRALHPYW